MKVLVPTEGSEYSMAAVQKCCKMFDESDNTEIRIMSAAEPIVTGPEPFAVSAAYIRDLETANLAKAKDAVSSAEAEIRKGLPSLADRLTTAVVKGSAKQAIVEEAESWGADVIVMGSHGYGFWQRTLLGSVSSSVVHHAPCSVLVVRRQEDC